jgi:hypothetical protein
LPPPRAERTLKPLPRVDKVKEFAMDEPTMNRRGVLRGAGAVSAVALAGVAGASPALAAEKGERGVTGSWLITRRDDPPGEPTRVRGVVSFAEGSVLISHDISPAGPPGTGTWVRQGGGRFKGTFWTGFPGDGGPGSPGPTLRVKIRGRVSKDMISGTYRFTLFAPTGAEIDSGTGTFSGERLEA